MSKKLGEALIERGRITADQLEMALRNQLMLGGHLGTCLIELGFADEEAVGMTLSALLRAPYATREMLTNIPFQVLAVVPKKLVEDYQVVPFELDEKRLHVAMVDPRNLPAQDALAFATDLRIVPWVAPEVRVLEAMERHYDLPRRTRYIAISRSLDRDAGEQSARPAAGPPKPRPAEVVAPRERERAGTEPGLEFGYGRSWVEVAEELSRKESAAAGPADPRGGAAGGLSGVADRLCAADDRGEIANTVLGFAAETLPRAALLAVKDDTVRLWEGRGFDPEEVKRADDAFPIAPGGIFDHLLGNDHYLGPLGSDPGVLGFSGWLGIEPPTEILLVPIHLNDRLVAILYGDGGPIGRVAGDAPTYLRLARMLGLALSALILKKKIRAAAGPVPSETTQVP